MTATEMAKKIGTRRTYKAGNFELKVTIVDLKDIVGEGTMCLVVARGAEGQEWGPLGEIGGEKEEKEKEKEKEIYAECSKDYYKDKEKADEN